MKMNGLERFLTTDPRDAGCGPAMDLLHVYVEQTLSRARTELRHAGITAHLRACDPCARDFEALLEVARTPPHGVVR
jgi:hypothetical protein